MALSDRPAERHTEVAGLFTERVRGTRSWDAPSPVAGWDARHVVRHLTEWFPVFLASGAGIGLPRGPSVDENPVAAWQVHCEGVQIPSPLRCAASISRSLPSARAAAAGSSRPSSWLVQAKPRTQSRAADTSAP